MAKNDSTSTLDPCEGSEMNSYHRALQSQFVAQWITSLAISVVCCAVLFVVFAGYIVNLHEKTNLAEVRIELLQEKQNSLASELAWMKRQPLVQINSGGQQPVVTETVPQAPEPDAGVKLDAAKAPDDHAPMQLLNDKEPAAPAPTGEVPPAKP